MWDELYEVLLGLAGAAVGLIALYAFIAHASEDGEEREDASAEGTTAEAHEALSSDEGTLSRPVVGTDRDHATPSVVKLFVSGQAGAPMQPVEAVEAIARRGLKGDRYCLGAGYWSESDPCEVTLIAQEDLDEIAATTGLQVQHGQHRRNIVTRGVDLASLIGRRFRIGAAQFAFARPRPPCLHLQAITEPGMARALVGRGGIGAHCSRGGTIRESDPIVLLEIPSFPALLRRLTSGFRERR